LYEARSRALLATLATARQMTGGDSVDHHVLAFIMFCGWVDGIRLGRICDALLAR